jgi:hypothetical protein
MIPMLLWRCPLCATDDALEQIARLLRAERVRCRACGAEWRMRRVPGDTFYLRLIRAGQGTDAIARPALGNERSIAAWYDAMKATVSLTPIREPALTLLPGEILYLASGPVRLQAEETDPIFFPAPESPPVVRTAKREVRGKAVGEGRLFLTDGRLVWQGEAMYAFPLVRLNSAYALTDDGLALMVEMRLYTVRFLRESLLKWVTHIALVARQVEAATGHRIATSHY